MGKEEWARKLGKLNIEPGPGEYDQVSTIGRDTPTFTIRNVLPSKEPQLGGAQVPYLNIPSSLNKNGPILSPRHYAYSDNTREKWTTPGPSYISPGLIKKSYSVRDKISHEVYEKPKRNFKPAYGQNLFGPAEYNIRTELGDNGPKISIGSRIKDPAEAERSPGPIYNPSNDRKCSSSRRHSIRPRTQIPDPNLGFPGPGQYKLPSDFAKKEIKIRNRIKDPDSKENNPGPGQYDVDQFGSGGRAYACFKGRGYWFEPKPNTAPYYKLPSCFDNPRLITIGKRTSPRSDDGSKKGGKRRKKPERDETPGPAAYYPEKPRCIRSCSFQKHDIEPRRITEASTYEEPSPCTYYPNYEAVKPSYPSFAFKDNAGAPPYKPIKDNEVPGPGAYKLPSNLTTERSPRIAGHARFRSPERECFTKDAGYYILPVDRGRSCTIHNKEYLDLVCEYQGPPKA